MKVGMLWLDRDKSQDLGTRVEQAVAYYHQKYGRRPNLCFLHPTTAGEDAPSQIQELRIQTSDTVLPDHFWIGVAEPNHAQVREQASMDFG
jgi:hypothetical protein